MSDPTPRGDRLATIVWNLCIEGDEQGWVSGLPPDARTILDAAVNEYCLTDEEYVAFRRRKGHERLCADGGPDVMSLDVDQPRRER